MSSPAATRKLVLLSPTERETRDLPRLAEALGVELCFDRFDDDYFDRIIIDSPQEPPPFDLALHIDQATERCRMRRADAVTSAVGYPGMSATALITQRLGLPGPRPGAVFACEHKYRCRELQRRVVPEATAGFSLFDPRHPTQYSRELAFPLFLKPLKSCMSMHAYRVDDQADLVRYANAARLPAAFREPFDRLAAAYLPGAVSTSLLLLEEHLQGQQVSVEGYVRCDKAHVLGIVDAVMYPGTYSFQRFQYPSALPAAVQARIRSIATRFIEAIDYGDALFNIEMIWNPRDDRIGIIEVNPKIASQFPDLFEKVDGGSTYTTLMEVALNLPVSLRPGQGKHQLAASCVLRTFEDRIAVRVPSLADIEKLTTRYPDARVQILARPGRRLSQDFQDPWSYRYALINLGAGSQSELLERLEDCKALLPFEWAACASS